MSDETKSPMDVLLEEAYQAELNARRQGLDLATLPHCGTCRCFEPKRKAKDPLKGKKLVKADLHLVEKP